MQDEEKGPARLSDIEERPPQYFEEGGRVLLERLRRTPGIVNVGEGDLKPGQMIITEHLEQCHCLIFTPSNASDAVLAHASVNMIPLSDIPAGWAVDKKRPEANVYTKFPSDSNIFVFVVYHKSVNLISNLTRPNSSLFYPANIAMQMEVSASNYEPKIGRKVPFDVNPIVVDGDDFAKRIVVWDGETRIIYIFPVASDRYASFKV